jgi:hypothetical protein
LIAAQSAESAAALAQEAADEAQSAIDSIVNLGAPGGPTINAANITVGSISGDRVTGGEIIGTTLKTASSGRRVEIQSTSTAYFDENDNFTGRVLGAGTDRGATLELTSGASGELQIWNGGVIMYGAGGTFAGLSDNGFAVGGNRLYTIGANIEADGNLVATGSMSSGSVSTGSVSCSSVSSTGAISGTTVSSTNFSGTVNTSIANNTQTSFSGNLFINSSGNMFRNPTISSREAKEDITPYEFDTDAFISIAPVTFKYKDGVIANPDEAGVDHLGFILEDFEEAGVAEHLTIQANEIDVYKGLRYDKLYMMLHKVVQTQQQTIKDLTARIEALETK